MRAAAVTIALVIAASSPASAYRIDRRVVPQPTLLYYVALPDWKKPFDRVVRDLNRAHVGVRLKKAQIPQQASIQVGRLEHRCGLPGVDGTTHTIQGGYAAIYLPRGCHAKIASIIAAHELGHALGLRHDDRRCALLNSSGTGPNGIPTQCLGQEHDWLHHPYRKDDIAGLRRLYRNTEPTARLRVTGREGSTITLSISAKDRERNISELKIDFGDGSSPATGYRVGDLPRGHTFAQAGTYKIRLTVTDFYSRRATATVKVTV
jgi:hypothetical protein